MPPGDPHSWNDLNNYLSVHDSWLARFEGYFLIDTGLKLEISQATLSVEGRLLFPGGLFIDVEKTLAINERFQVRTTRYSYHAGIAGRSDRPVFRYDNAHPHPGHQDEHHKHTFDPVTWREIKPPVCDTRWVADAWPCYSGVVRLVAGDRPVSRTRWRFHAVTRELARTLLTRAANE